jgi:hypothetical protein
LHQVLYLIILTLLRDAAGLTSPAPFPRKGSEAYMTRILLLLTVVALMVAMMVVMAAPALADHSIGHEHAEIARDLIVSCLADQSGPGVSECAQQLPG